MHPRINSLNTAWTHVEESLELGLKAITCFPSFKLKDKFDLQEGGDDTVLGQIATSNAGQFAQISCYSYIYEEVFYIVLVSWNLNKIKRDVSSSKVFLSIFAFPSP